MRRGAGGLLVPAVAVGSGAMVALQQRVNGELKDFLGDALVAALVSFGTGLAVVAVLVAMRRRSRAALVLVRSVPWWMRIGGLGGATLVAVGAAAAPMIGVALLTVGLVAGQTTGGILVDRVGLGPGGARPFSVARVAGALVCLLAVGISAFGQGVRAASPVLLGLVLLAGFLVSFQQAVNGQVRAATGDVVVATLVNFVVGFAALLAGLGLRLLVHGLSVHHWPGLRQWYLYSGGPLGATFVAVAAVVVRRLGVLRLGLAVTAGQLAGAVVLDELLPVHARPVAALTLLAVAMTFVAVLVSGRREAVVPA